MNNYVKYTLKLTLQIHFYRVSSFCKYFQRKHLQLSRIKNRAAFVSNLDPIIGQDKEKSSVKLFFLLLKKKAREKLTVQDDHVEVRLYFTELTAEDSRRDKACQRWREHQLMMMIKSPAVERAAAAPCCCASAAARGAFSGSAPRRR